MMKKALVSLLLITLSVACFAEDFATKYLHAYPDSTMQSISVSPKMMQKVLAIEDNEALSEAISQIKSLRILIAQENRLNHYLDAIQLAEQEPALYQETLQVDQKQKELRILLRKRNEEVIELIMLVSENDCFKLIDFTGKIDMSLIPHLSKKITQPAKRAVNDTKRTGAQR